VTAFTLNGGATTNWDTLTGGSVNATLDTYAISNNTTLVIDTDSYQCAGHSTAFGSLDTVTFSGVGGRLKLDGKNVRVIPFNTGASTVPAIGTTITQGGVSSVLLGVWSSWQTEPLAEAAAMPATGYIKVKNKTGGNYAAGALTGISASATGADVVGWIEVRGADLAQITVPRIGAFETDGDWFELGTTNGARGQVIPCPTTATIAGAFSGVWIETAAASGVYERFPSCGSMVNLAANPTDERGKIIWQTTGGIRIGSDGVNNVGFLPPTGCRVRIPNIIMTCCTRTVSGSGLRVLPNATLATRQEFVTTSAGDIQLVGCVMQWYGAFLQAFRVKLLNVAISDSLLMQEVASPMDANNVIVAPTQAQLNFALNMASCFAGGTMAEMSFARFSLAAASTYTCIVNYCQGIAFNNTLATAVTNRANATTGTWTLVQSQNCTWTNAKLVGGRVVQSACKNNVWTNTKYADLFSGTTTATNPHYAFDLSNSCDGIKVDGIDFFGIANVHPYNGICTANACYSTTVRRIGTRVAPLNLGSANASGLIFNGAGNCDGVRLQRIYVVNTRTGPWAFLNNDTNVVMENVYSDYADTSVIAALNCTSKSVALTGATTGQVSVYGTHWKSSFTSATVGKIEVLCNEPTATSALQCAITSGLPQFNSAGQVALTVVGQQVTWEMPFFALGLNALANLAPTLTGTTTGNLTYEFQYDIGSGYNGTWLTLNAANQNGVGAINPLVGIKLKIRATCATAAAGNLLTNIAVPAITTAVDQGDSVYPLDVNTVTFTGLQTGSDIVVLLAGTGTIVAQVDAFGSSSYGYQYETSGVAIDIGFHKAGYVPQYIRNYTLPSSNASLPITQVADRNYV
jgi:hypothetical protein